MSEAALKQLSMESTKDNLWVELEQTGLVFRITDKGKYIRESKFNLTSESGFAFNTLKSKLSNKIFFNLRGDYLINPLHEMFKKKRTGVLEIKIITDPYVPSKVRRSYILLTIHTDFGNIQNIVQCFLC
jgi:hypothetical protein